MFKSSDKQTKDVLSEGNLPSSPALPNTTTEETTITDRTSNSPKLNNLESQPNDDERMATLLQKASSEMDVVGAVAAALSIKSSKEKKKKRRTIKAKEASQ